MTLKPRASSLMTMSATLMRLVVLVSSAREETVLVRLRAVGGRLISPSGGSLISVTTREKAADTGVLPGREGSLTETVTA